MVRKISEINKELDELAISVRMERKLGLVRGDIEECKRQLLEVEPKIKDIDTKLDLLYANLRKALGIDKRRDRQREQQRPREKEQKPQHNQEINLEDIAVIKKK